LRVGFAAGGVVHIETPAYLAKDGTLANATVHQKLRDALTKALGLGDPEVEQLEAHATARSLRVTPPEPIESAMQAGEHRFVIVTTLDREAVEAAFRRVRAPFVSGAARHRFVFGMGADQESGAEIALAGDDPVNLDVAITLRPTGSYIRDLTAWTAARALCSNLNRQLVAADPAATWTGPDSLIEGS
jgi:hypothetical protein